MSMSELHFATICGHKEIVSQLLSAGSDSSILLRNGKTCSEFAALIGQTEIKDVLDGANSKDNSSVFSPNVATVTCE